MTDLESRIRSTLTHVAGTTAVPPFPGLDPTRDAPSLRRWRRSAAAAAATVLIVGSGVGVAAAAGVFSTTPTGYDAFGFAYYPGEPGPHAQPGTARTVLRTRGPRGSKLTLRIADPSSGRGYCSELATTRGRLRKLAGCRRSVSGFGELDQVLSTVPATAQGLGTTEFSAIIAGATTVAMTFDNGSSVRLPAADGFTVGWFTDKESLERPVLVGYGPAGNVVGRADLITENQRAHFRCQPHC